MPATPLRRKLLIGVSILTIVETIGLCLHVFLPSVLRPVEEPRKEPSPSSSILLTRIKREVIPRLNASLPEQHNSDDLLQLQRETNSLLRLIYERLNEDSRRGLIAPTTDIPPPTTVSPKLLKLRESMRPPEIRTRVNIPSQLFAGLCHRMINEFLLSVKPPASSSNTSMNGTIGGNATTNSIMEEPIPESESVDEKLNHHMDILCILLGLVSIGILVLGIYLDIQRLFLPWLVFYGIEIFCGYLVFPSFLTMTGRFRLAGLVVCFRTFNLTYLWIMFVRRHLKEIIALAPRHMNLVDHVRFVLKEKLEPIGECD